MLSNIYTIVALVTTRHIVSNYTATIQHHRTKRHSQLRKRMNSHWWPSLECRTKLDDTFMCNDTVSKADIHFCQKPMEPGLNTLEDCLFSLLDTQACELSTVVRPTLVPICTTYYVLPICTT